MTVIDLFPDTGAERDIRIVAADHPSLDDGVRQFLDDLRAEPRYFGPSARQNPKPFRSLIEALGRRGGFKMAAIDGERLVGLARADADGEVHIAIAADRRDGGIGTQLGRALAGRAVDLQYARLVIRSMHHGSAVRRVGESLGCTVVDVGRGRVDMIVDLASRRSSA